MSNWYATENDGWYAPLTQNEPAAEKPVKKSRSWIKALIAVLVVIGLITGSALIFPNKSAKPEIVKPSQKEDSNDSNFGQFIIPREDDDDTMPDDYREFFENFYTAVDDSRTSINIEKTERPKGFECTIAPADEELSLQELYRRCSKSNSSTTATPPARKRVRSTAYGAWSRRYAIVRQTIPATAT